MPKRNIKDLEKIEVKQDEMLASILDNDGTKDDATQPTKVKAERATTKKVTKKATAKPAKKSTSKKMGRPATGKSNNDAYKQVTVYVDKALHRAARMRMIELEEGGEKLDFSEYVNKLIAKDVK